MALSFESRPGAGNVDRVAEVVQRELGRVRTPTAVVVFCCGALARQLLPLAEAIARRVPNELPVLLASGSGVLSERGEIHADSAATGLILGEGKPELLACDHELGDADFDWLLCRAPPRTASLAFLRGQNPPRLPSCGAAPLVVGAGTSLEPGLAVVVEGRARAVVAATLRLVGTRTPAVRVAQGCRLLGPLLPVTRADGPVVLELAGHPALDKLQQRARGLSGRPTVLVALSDRSAPTPEQWRVRPIQGVDTDRGGLLIGSELERSSHLSFCVRDPAVGRSNLEAACRSLRRDVAGAAPRFGVFINGAGRGKSLPGSDVDFRIVRDSFPSMPLAGLTSEFEIAPGPAAQLHSGTLAIVSSPS